MRIENAFEVPGPPETTMALLLDAEQVVPCMPGAELVEVIDERTWRAKMTVKLGPVGMSFDNRVRLEAIDEAAGTVRMAVSGRDSRGKGGAEGTVDASFRAVEGDATRVELVTDLRFSGQAAQLGRPNVVQDVATRMVDQFARCLGERMALAREASSPAADGQARAAGPPPAPPRPPAELSVLSVLGAVVRGALGRAIEVLTARLRRPRRSGGAS